MSQVAVFVLLLIALVAYLGLIHIIADRLVDGWELADSAMVAFFAIPIIIVVLVGLYVLAGILIGEPS